MFRPQCLFCGHENPAGAKFCNDCGSPLHLKSCNQCGGINDLRAKNCYKCGAELPTQLLATENPAVSPAANATVVASPLSQGDFERKHTPLPESAAEALDLFRQPSRNGPTAKVEVVARKQLPPTGGVLPFFSVEQHATHAVSVRQSVVRRPSMAHGTLSAVLVVMLALSGYYIYHAQRGDWLTTKQSDSAGASSATRTSSSVETTNPASPTTASLATDGTSSEVTSGPALPVASASDAPSSQATQGRIRASEPVSLDAEALTPARSHAAAPSQAVLAPNGIAGKSRQEALTAGERRVIPKQTASIRLAATPPDPALRVLLQPRPTDTVVNVPPEMSRPRDCTEAIAALGFCHPNAGGESN